METGEQESCLKGDEHNNTNPRHAGPGCLGGIMETPGFLSVFSSKGLAFVRAPHVLIWCILVTPRRILIRQHSYLAQPVLSAMYASYLVHETFVQWGHEHVVLLLIRILCHKIRKSREISG